MAESGAPYYGYAYDSMGRLSSLYEPGNSSPSATATYGVAGEVQGLTYWAVNETRQYNSMFQMTRMTATAFGTTVMDMQYNYTTGQNNGRIASSVDGYLNETVNYTYDALNRLSGAAATNGAWGQSFAYDGFGNLTDKTPTVGSAPSLHVTFDAGTNRQNGVTYDANGNPASLGTFDVENRVLSMNGFFSVYDHRGKRITKAWGSNVEMYFYGIDGRKLATYTCGTTNFQFTCGSPVFDTYWKGKLVKSKGQEVTTDRLGSVRWHRTVGWSAYYPYGEERGSSADNREKFGTYVRDDATLDYADQRYYGVGTGRFLTADPSGLRAARLQFSGSWNRFSYVMGDPINRIDLNGADWVAVECNPEWDEDCDVEPYGETCNETCDSGVAGDDSGGEGTMPVFKTDSKPACTGNTYLSPTIGVGCVAYPTVFVPNVGNLFENIPVVILHRASRPVTL